MTTQTLTPHAPRRGAPLQLRTAAPGLYRVIDGRNRIVGHIQLVAHELGTRYRARHYSPERLAFADLGDFWSIDDALACLVR